MREIDRRTSRAVDALTLFRRGPVPRNRTDECIMRLQELPADSMAAVKELQSVKREIRWIVDLAAVSGVYEQTLTHGIRAMRLVAEAEDLAVRRLKNGK